MRKSAFIASIATLALVTGGCSTRPRNFVAQINSPVSDTATLENDYRTCTNLVHAGHTSNFRDAALTGAAGYAGAYGTAAGIAATGVGWGAFNVIGYAIPVVGVLASFGTSRMIRSGRERRIHTAMADCLAEYGYTVADWERIESHQEASSLVSSRLIAPDTVAADQIETGSDPEVATAIELAAAAQPAQ